MCLLTFLPAGVQPDVPALRDGAVENPDGHGFAVVAGHRLIVERGMHADAVIDAFARTRGRHPHGPALFHSRLTTHGRTEEANCHPFPVGGDPRTVLAHNGVLPAAVQPAGRDPRSDTRIAAEEFLIRFGSPRLHRTRQRLQRWMTDANKMVILTVDRRFRERAYVLNEHAGSWHDGIWYSDPSFLPRRLGLPGWLGDDELWPDDAGYGWCLSCAVPLDRFGWCPGCDRCADCGTATGDCLCHWPAALMRSGHRRGDD